MANIKVLPLKPWMKKALGNDRAFLCAPIGLLKTGRDGCYCQRNLVWFEYNGNSYVYSDWESSYHRRYFEHKLLVNDDAILSQKEYESMSYILKVSRDHQVKKILQKRLLLHSEAVDLRKKRREFAFQIAKIKLRILALQKENQARETKDVTE